MKGYLKFLFRITVLFLMAVIFNYLTRALTDCINNPTFPGEYPAALLGFLVSLITFPFSVYKLGQYWSKTKEVK
jgi:hypothetical protein